MAKSGPGGGWSWNALEIQIQIQLQIPGSKYIETWAKIQNLLVIIQLSSCKTKVRDLAWGGLGGWWMEGSRNTNYTNSIANTREQI